MWLRAYVATGEAEALRQLAARLRRPRWLIGRRKHHIVDDDAPSELEDLEAIFVVDGFFVFAVCCTLLAIGVAVFLSLSSRGRRHARAVLLDAWAERGALARIVIHLLFGVGGALSLLALTLLPSAPHPPRALFVLSFFLYHAADLPRKLRARLWEDAAHHALTAGVIAVYAGALGPPYQAIFIDTFSAGIANCVNAPGFDALKLAARARAPPTAVRAIAVATLALTACRYVVHLAVVRHQVDSLATLGVPQYHPIHLPSYVINLYFMALFDPYCSKWLLQQRRRARHAVDDLGALRSAGRSFLRAPHALSGAALARLAEAHVASTTGGVQRLAGALPHAMYDCTGEEAEKSFGAHRQWCAERIAEWLERLDGEDAAAAMAVRGAAKRARWQYRVNRYEAGEAGPRHRDSHLLTFIFASLPADGTFGGTTPTPLADEAVVVVGLAGSALIRAAGGDCAESPPHRGGCAAGGGGARWSLAVFWTPALDEPIGGGTYRQMRDANLITQAAYRRRLFSPQYCYHPTPVADGARGATISIDGKECIDLHGGHGTLLWGSSDIHVRGGGGGGLVIGQHTDATFDVVAALRAHAGGGMPHVMFTTTGSQATALAVRMARRVTKRQRLLVFSGSWHGWAAEFEGGQEPTVRRVPAYEKFAPSRDIAAIIVEPFRYLRKRLGTHPEWTEEKWLRHVQAQAKACGALFVLDETVSGFRFEGGARRRYGLEPDLIVYGKSLGGGLPLAALVAAEHAYTAEVQTAGTFVCHSLIMGAARSFLLSLPRVDYGRLDRLAGDLVARLNAIDGLVAAHEGSIVQVDVPAAARDKNERLPALEGALLRHGVFVQTASFLFVSEAFDEKVVAEAARRWERAVSEVYGNTAL